MASIRPATPDDAGAIAGLIHAAFPNVSADERQAARALRAPDHATHVAEDGGCLAGFVDGFVTRSLEGVRRWEVDLIGVSAAQRGRGIATRLIEASVAAGREHGCAFARALVRLDNTASQRAFARAGFEVDAVLRLIYVCSQNAGAFYDTAKFVACDAPEERPDWLLPVETLTYRGGWIEAEPTWDRLQCAVAARVSFDWDSVGVLVPAEQAQFFEVADGIDYEFAGAYQWWVRRWSPP